ncbi:MAG TPA: hypothetical protein VLV83_01425 [Acidobacteriota bacterium]|nr:hypothetical protein [Acidobacteriota bacterium]
MKRNWPLGSQSKALLEAIKAWTKELHPGTVEVMERSVPVSDDEPLNMVLELRPTKPGACPITLMVDESWATGTELDDWAHIARMAQLSVRSGQGNRVGLYVEPTSLPVKRILRVGSKAL